MAATQAKAGKPVRAILFRYCDKTKKNRRLRVFSVAKPETREISYFRRKIQSFFCPDFFLPVFLRHVAKNTRNHYSSGIWVLRGFALAYDHAPPRTNSHYEFDKLHLPRPPHAPKSEPIHTEGIKFAWKIPLTVFFFRLRKHNRHLGLESLFFRPNCCESHIQ